MSFLAFINLLNLFIGALVTVDVTVCDEAGAPVPNIGVNIGTYTEILNLNERCKTFSKRTDASGRATFRYAAIDPEFNCSVYSPDGEYESQSINKIRFKATSTAFTTSFKEKRKSVHFVIKKKPIPEKIIVSAVMAGKAVPVDKGTLGFDLMKHDWVPPHGKGKVADFWIDYERKVHKNDLDEIAGRLFFKEKDAGFYIVKREQLQESGNNHADPQAVYSSSRPFYYREILHRPSVCTDLALNGECLVLRTRIEHSGEGKVSTAHYSVVNGPFFVWRSMRMDGYVFNTRPNDVSF